MSQAVSAPSTGDPFLTGGKSANATDIPTGNIGRQSPSRRAVLAGMLLAPAAAAMPTVVAAADQAEAWEDPVLQSKRVDAIFWAQRDKWMRVREAWKADDARAYLTDAENDRYCAEVESAEYSMMTCRIVTLPALYAKMQAIQEEPENKLHGGNDPTTMFDVLMWDVERLIMKEYRA